MSTETIKLIRDRKKDGRGYGGGARGGLHTYCYTVTTRMTPTLRWAATRAILMFHQLWGTKSQDGVHRPQLLKRKQIQTKVPLLTSLTPYHSAKPAHIVFPHGEYIYICGVPAVEVICLEVLWFGEGVLTLLVVCEVHFCMCVSSPNFPSWLLGWGQSPTESVSSPYLPSWILW